MVKILILGGGFGGVRCALNLESKLKETAEITVVDKNGYHLFIPSIYEVASAFGIKKDPFAIQLKKTVCIPYTDIFEGKNIKFVEGEVAEVNLETRKAITKGGHIMEYDYLVFNLGAEVHDYNIPGVTEYANQFKTVEDAVFINQKLEELTSQFSSNSRSEPFSFLICGGGFTGVELSAELGTCSGNIKRKTKLKGRASNITIFEAGPRILPPITDKERTAIKSRLTHLGVSIMENSPIEEVGPDSIKLKNGQRIQGDLIIWTAGIRSNRMLSGIKGLPLSPAGKIMVGSDLTVNGYNNIFALGDNTEFIDARTQKPVPALAYVASDQGKIAATNIYNAINNKKYKKYNPYYSVYILPVGGKYAVGHFLFNLSIKGFMAWILRIIIDVKYFLGILSPYKAFKLYMDEMTVFLKND